MFVIYSKSSKNEFIDHNACACMYCVYHLILFYIREFKFNAEMGVISIINRCARLLYNCICAIYYNNKSFLSKIMDYIIIYNIYIYSYWYS